jgi:hypothetical protein
MASDTTIDDCLEMKLKCNCAECKASFGSFDFFTFGFGSWDRTLAQPTLRNKFIGYLIEKGRTYFTERPTMSSPSISWAATAESISVNMINPYPRHFLSPPRIKRIFSISPYLLKASATSFSWQKQGRSPRNNDRQCSGSGFLA